VNSYGILMLHPLASINYAEQYGGYKLTCYSQNIMFATNQTFLAVEAIRSYDDFQVVNSNVTYENTNVVKRDLESVSWH
jgi:hypothetical protein